MNRAEDKIRTAVLISGKGSNLQALMAATAAPAYPAHIVLVISNRVAAAGLQLARDAGIPALAIPHDSFATRAAFEEALNAALMQHDVELVCLAGFMRVLGDALVARWAGRMINIHPSLLPKYRGLDTHARVLEAGDPAHGCTVHHVTPDLDGGAIIAQRTVPVLPGDTPDLLAARVQAAEHLLYPEALAQAARAMR